MPLESSDEVLRANNWHNVILTYDTTTGINIFLDGIAVASNNDTIDITPDGLLQNIVIGSNITANFDEVKLYNKTLNQDEIEHLAFDGNYAKNIANTLYDLKFNELTHIPTDVVDDKTQALYSATNAVYDVGFVGGSKSIRMENGGFIELASSAAENTYSGVSISAWINLDTLTNTSQHILKKEGVIDFVININSLALTLGETSMTFVDIIPSPPMLNDEKFHFNDPTTTFGGARSETIVNPKFYSNKLTLSTWVKNDPAVTTQQNIVSIGDRLHIGLNATKQLECQVDVMSSTTTVSRDVSAYTIDNVNYSGNIFNNTGIGTDTIAFDVTSPNALLKYKLKRLSFGVPFRNYAPLSLSVIGVDGATETTFITYPILFKNSNHVYDIVIDDINASLDNDKVKVQFNGSGIIKVKNVNIETLSEDSITASITSDAKTVTISGNVSLTGTINVYSEETRLTILKYATINSDNSFILTFEDTRDPGTYDYYLSVKNGADVINFDGLNLSAELKSGAVSASGGTESTYISSGITYKVHKFTSSENFTVSTGGEVEYLIVAGGGGGAYDVGGGGGGGGLLTGTVSIIEKTYSIVVGSGGSERSDGENSSALGIIAIGGGAGGGYFDSKQSGRSGGSGGGGASGSNSPGGDGGNGVENQGNRGGNGGNTGYKLGRKAGGGGGAGAQGQDMIGGNNGLNGGVGFQSAISGTNTYYAGGGGGGAHYSGYRAVMSGGSGGLGGGGNGGYSGTSSGQNTSGQHGTINTGGGGGGGVYRTLGGSGGSAIIIIRYPQ
jgi:hypothetical protein